MQHFLSFLQCFQKTSSSDVIMWNCKGKDLRRLLNNLGIPQSVVYVVKVDSIKWSFKKKHCGKRRKCCLPAFSPFPTMFSKGLILRCHNTGLFVKGFYPFPNKPWFFTCLQYKSLENTVGKGEIARNKQFLFFPQCFLPVWRTFCHFRQIQNCPLQSLSVWKSLKFVVW